MAAGTKIVFEFYGATGKSMNLSYNYGDEEASITSVNNAMNTIIANNAIFKNPPTSIKGAKAIVTRESEFDLNP